MIGMERQSLLLISSVTIFALWLSLMLSRDMVEKFEECPTEGRSRSEYIEAGTDMDKKKCIIRYNEEREKMMKEYNSVSDKIMSTILTIRAAIAAATKSEKTERELSLIKREMLMEKANLEVYRHTMKKLEIDIHPRLRDKAAEVEFDNKVKKTSIEFERVYNSVEVALMAIDRIVYAKKALTRATMNAENQARVHSRQLALERNRAAQARAAQARAVQARAAQTRAAQAQAQARARAAQARASQARASQARAKKKSSSTKRAVKIGGCSNVNESDRIRVRLCDGILRTLDKKYRTFKSVFISKGRRFTNYYVYNR